MAVFCFTPSSQASNGNQFGLFSSGGMASDKNSTPALFGATSSASSSITAFGASSPQPAFASSQAINNTQFGLFSGRGSLSSKNSMPAFGATSSVSSSIPAFGTSSPLPAFASFQAPNVTQFGSISNEQSVFGKSSMPAFGLIPSPSLPKQAFGALSPQPTFGSPIFNQSSGSAFGQTQSMSRDNAFGRSSPFGFGPQSQSSFSTATVLPSSTSTVSFFGPTSNTPSRVISSTPCSGGGFSFGQSTSLFADSTLPGITRIGTQTLPGTNPPVGTQALPGTNPPFGTPTLPGTTPPFGTQTLPGTTPPFTTQTLPSTTPPFWTQTLPSGFGHTVVDGLAGGSKVTRYAKTLEENGNGAKIESICAMKSYFNKSPEELRLEDYQSLDKGGNRHTGQSPIAIRAVNSWANLSSSSVAPSNTFSFAFPAVDSNPIAPRTPTFVPSQNPFTSLTPPNIPGGNRHAGQLAPPTLSFSSIGFNASTAALNSTSSIMFPLIISPPMRSISTTSTITSVQDPTSGPPICTSPCGLVTAPSFPSFSFVKSTPAPEITSTFNSQPAQPFQFVAPSTTHSSIQQNVSSSSPIDMNPWGNISSSTTGSGSSDSKGVGGQSIEGQESVTGSTEAMRQLPVTNPFGTPNVVQISIDRPVTAVSIQYGISSRPVSDNPAPVRRSSLLRVRQLSLTRNWLPAPKNSAKSDGPKVPFFADEEKPDLFKADASFISRENPRSWILSPSVLKSDSGKSSEVQSTIVNLNEDGTPGGTTIEHDHNSCKEEDLNVKIHGNQYEKAACVGPDVDVESFIPSLRNADYYTVPSTEVLAANEKAEPGFCCHVKDFVVGRHGYGSIKFLGETDIRKLDLDSFVQFNYREVQVYMDEGKRPPVGQGLNKPAEVTLLNVKCIGRNTGKQYTDGPNVDRYKEMLIKKAKEQGAEFISYDPVVGEWKFKVQHF